MVATYEAKLKPPAPVRLTNSEILATRVFHLGPKSSWSFLMLASEKGLLRTHLKPYKISATEWKEEIQSEFPDHKVQSKSEILDLTEKQMKEYFKGNRKDFDVPLDLHRSGTDFQQTVWGQLLKIPFGKVWTYGELAKRVKRPKGARAVGQANGRNPIPVIVPCHRVVASGGALGGFTGGLNVKRFLLDHESVSYKD